MSTATKPSATSASRSAGCMSKSSWVTSRPCDSTGASGDGRYSAPEALSTTTSGKIRSPTLLAPIPPAIPTTSTWSIADASSSRVVASAAAAASRSRFWPRPARSIPRCRRRCRRRAGARVPGPAGRTPTASVRGARPEAGRSPVLIAASCRNATRAAPRVPASPDRIPNGGNRDRSRRLGPVQDPARAPHSLGDRRARRGDAERHLRGAGAEASGSRRACRFRGELLRVEHRGEVHLRDPDLRHPVGARQRQGVEVLADVDLARARCLRRSRSGSPTRS